MDIRMICIDLDGTALLNDHRTMCPEVLRALEDAHEKGIRIAPVTGRQFHLLPDFFRTHPRWENLAVLCNGAQVRRLCDGTVLRRLDIPQEALEELLVLAQRYSLPLEFSMDSVLYLTEEALALEQEDPQLRFHREAILPRHGRIVPSMLPLCRGQVEKVNLLCIPESVRDQAARDLEELAVSAVFSSANSMEITHPQATKGGGVQALCELEGICMESVMAIGDSGNDVDMLRSAGLGVAMGNAPDFVKAVADAVTGTNDQQGAAIAIRRYAL